ncbi:hypothetical protein [Streptomyces sp. NPDC000229]|uniref:hypothetical protein n=1 Tax=Streptomyces sp. NPDC000229 TaxID=3154247 RepID=UPI00403790AE
MTPRGLTRHGAHQSAGEPREGQVARPNAELPHHRPRIGDRRRGEEPARLPDDGVHPGTRLRGAGRGDEVTPGPYEDGVTECGTNAAQHATHGGDRHMEASGVLLEAARRRLYCTITYRSGSYHANGGPARGRSRSSIPAGGG